MPKTYWDEEIAPFKLQAGIQDNPDQEGIELFAKLIIQECIKEVEFQYNGGREINETTHSPDWNEAVECISAFIRHRFGISK